MKMIGVLFLAFLFQPLTLKAGSTPQIGLCRGSDLAGQKIRRMVVELIQNEFTDLKQFNIEICAEFTDGESFFRASPKISTLVYGSRRRIYDVFFHPEIFSTSLSDGAIKAVLAHELAHVLSYTHMSSIDLAHLAIAYEWADITGDYTFVNCYERATDYMAARRGFAAGLTEYSNWVLGKLSSTKRAKKRLMYLSPVELAKIAQDQPMSLQLSPECRVVF